MFSIQYQITRFQLTPRNHAALMKEINAAVMERQLATRVPKHFTEQAYSLYGARKRTKAYNEKKQKYGKAGIAPNVYSGRLRDSIRGKITATQKGAKLRLTAQMNDRVPQAEWDAMSPLQQANEKKKNRRLAGWQKQEIAKMSRSEIKMERERSAAAYVRGATGKYRRIRRRRTK